MLFNRQFNFLSVRLNEEAKGITMIHMIPNGDTTIVYCCDTMNYYVFPKGEAEELADGIDNAEHALSVLGSQKEIYEDEFSTLILNVSNDCNMRCKYCFANHGAYQSPKGMMNADIACKALDEYANKYHKIKEVKFFGGEPLMNTTTIEAVCKHTYSLYAEGVLKKLPRFKAITNGTILNDKVLELIDKYGLNIVFSIDGPPEVHNMARVFVNGEATFNVIRNNFNELKKRTLGAQPCSIEVTYSNAHLLNGMSMADTVKYLYCEFDLEPGQVNVSLVNLSINDPLALPDGENCWSDFAKDVIQRKQNGEGFLGDLKLMGLIHRIKNHKVSSNILCSAGNSWAAISSSGKIYPCLMFIDQNDFYMGCVSTAFLNTDTYRNISQKFSVCHKQNNPCAKCFAKQVCNRCAGINYFLTGDISGNDPHQCQIMRDTVEILIKGIANGIV